MYFANDGGVLSCSEWLHRIHTGVLNNTNHFDSLKNAGIDDRVRLDVTGCTDPATILGGTQDNGSACL